MSSSSLPPPRSDHRAGTDRRAVRVLSAAGLLVLTLLMVPVAVSRATLTYYLPSHQPGGSYSDTVAWGPGVVAAVVAVIAVLAEIGWLLLNVRRRPSPRLWFAAGAVALLPVLVTVVVAVIPTPAF